MTNLPKVDVADNVTTITLNDPRTLNAITPEVGNALRDALAMGQKQSRAIVLTGGSKAFSSGANLSPDLDIKPGAIDAGQVLEEVYNGLMMDIRNLDVPFITAVNGAAAGVGASLAMAGDLIVAGKSAYFLEAFCHIGLVPDGGATWMLTRNLGRVRAAELALLGGRFGAEEAHKAGMVTRVVEDAEVIDTAAKLAVKIAKGPTHALGLTRQLLWQAGDASFDAQLQAERVAQKSAGEHPDFAEGVAAFWEKRKADFS